MAKFNSRSLQVMDRILRFVGGSRPGREMDLASPIVRVFDVSREAEIGSGYGAGSGYAIVSRENTHAGAGDEYGPIDVFSVLTTMGVIPAEKAGDTWVWLLALTGETSSVSNLSNMRLAVSPPSSWPPSSYADQKYFPLQSFTDMLLFCSVAAGDVKVPWEVPTNPIPIFPLPLVYGSFFTIRTTASAACTATAHFLVWVGPIGVSPPGLR